MVKWMRTGGWSEGQAGWTAKRVDGANSPAGSPASRHTPGGHASLCVGGKTAEARESVSCTVLRGKRGDPDIAATPSQKEAGE